MCDAKSTSSKTEVKVEECTFRGPGGVEFKAEEGKTSADGHLTALPSSGGQCGLEIRQVTERDNGNWR